MKRVLYAIAALAIGCTALIAPSLRAESDAPSEFIAKFDSTVPPQARGAIQAGLTLLAHSLSTEVPVLIKVEWESLPPFVAGGSEPLGFAIDPQTGYQVPIALANARAGVDLDPNRDDIRLVFSNRERWHYDVNTPAAAGETDLMSFTLHEVIHGLGFYSGSRKQGGVVVFGNPNGEGVPGPTLLDGMLITTVGAWLVDRNPVQNIVSGLLASITNEDVVWGGNARDASGNRPKMSSGAFEPHTSLMHLDEAAYAAGSPDALMTTTIKRGENARSIGPAALGILRDLGWPVQLTPAPIPVQPSTQGRTATAPKPATTAQPEAAAPLAATPTTVADATPTPSGKPATRTAPPASTPGSSASPLGIIVAALVLAGIAWRVVVKVRAISQFLESVGLGNLVKIRFRPFQQFAGVDD